MPSTVLVTGATGFIAIHIVGLLLSKGHSVVGTVRSQSKGDALLAQFSKKLGGSPKLKLAVVEDIGAPGAFDKLFQEHTAIEYVLHTATGMGIPGSTDMEEIYLKPALNGTLGILNSIKAHAPQVKSVGITSSIATVCHPTKMGDETFVHTEETWNPITWDDVPEFLRPTGYYMAAKKAAEQAAWKFVKENTVNFGLTTFLPPMVVGPQYFDENAAEGVISGTATYATNVLKTTLDDKSVFDPTAVFTTPSIDVRDVARAHAAILEKDLSNHRLLLCAETTFGVAITLAIANEKFPDLKGKIYYVSPEEAEDSKKGTGWVVDSSKSNALLGIDWIPYNVTVVDAIKQYRKVNHC